MPVVMIFLLKLAESDCDRMAGGRPGPARGLARGPSLPERILRKDHMQLIEFEGSAAGTDS